MTTETAPKTAGTKPAGSSRTPSAARAKATGPSRKSGGRKRGEGQWALGYREPLNPNEQSKKDDHPLNVRERIENIYAKRGFSSIDPNDLRGRFRWYGLYTQRRPGIDGGKTATLEPWELDDEYFMLRIRIDGGALTTEQLRVIGQISVDFARDTADVTDRQNVQLHWVRIEDVPEIWRRLEAVGLQTTEACGDCPRVILGSPVAGIAAEEIIDPTPAIRDIVDRYIGDPEYANLPRKFKLSVSGCLEDCAQAEINDIGLWPARLDDGTVGFNVLVGGGLSDGPRMASDIDVFVDPEPEQKGSQLDFARHFPADAKPDVMFFGGFGDHLDQAQDGRVRRFIKVRNALVHAIDRNSVLNQIVRADAEKIDVVGEGFRANRRAWNFDHGADLHFGIEWDASGSQFAFAFIHHLERTTQLGFSRNHRKHQFDVTELAGTQNRP